MKKKKQKRDKKGMRLRDKLAKILNLSWIRFEERIPEPHKDDEEHSMWFRNF